MSNQSNMPDPRYSQANEPTQPVSYPPQQQYRNDVNNAPQQPYVNNAAPVQAAPNRIRLNAAKRCMMIQTCAGRMDATGRLPSSTFC